MSAARRALPEFLAFARGPSLAQRAALPASGAWHARHGHLLGEASHQGARLVIAQTP